MNTRHYFVIVLLTLLHFVVSSVYGHYIAKQVGEELGNIVGHGLIESDTSSTSSDEAASDIYEGMEKRTDEVYKRWWPHLFIVSLPSGPLMKPLWHSVTMDWADTPLLSKQISVDTWRMRAKVVSTLERLTNSLSFGLILYVLFRILIWRQQKRGLE